MYIYLDESGDLGFDFTKIKTSKMFVVTLLCCNTNLARKDIEKAIQRTLIKINKPKSKARRVTEIKGSKTLLKYKQYFLRQISNEDWGIYSILLNKKRINSELQTKQTKPRLYNFLSRIILEKLPLENATANVRLIVDRSKNREEIKDFNQYLRGHIESRLPLNTGFKIEHLTSHESKGLQAVDLFCWGIARKYLYKDYQWYDHFMSKILYETVYLKSN